MREFITSMAEEVSRNFRFQTIDGEGGVPIHMGEAGEQGAPAIIFIHGLAQSSLAWIQQMASGLADDFHIIVYDLRGHGASAKPWMNDCYKRPETTAGDLKNVADAANVEKFAAVAWSYGGYVLTDYIRQFGDAKLTKINLVGTLAALVERPETGATNPEKIKAAQAPAVSINPLGVIEANFGQADFVTNSAVTSNLQKLIEIITNQFPAYAKKAMIAAPSSPNNFDLPSRITRPVLLSIGTKDWTVPKVSVESLLTKLPTATLSEYTGCGHSPFLEQPDRFNAELKDFILAT